MAEEQLKMEARLENFISKEIHGIRNDLKAFEKTAKDSFTGANTGANTFLNTMKGFVSAQAVLGAARKAWSLFNTTAIESASLYKEQVDMHTKLNTVLQSTGYIAGLTFDELVKMATGLQAVTTTGDEMINSAQHMLLTFTRIGKDVFPQTVETVLNMGNVFGNVQNAAIQVGKALNEPIQGVTALRRVGVQLSSQQEAQIKQFMDINNIAGAQKVILQELQTEFGGVARELAKTDVGKLKQVEDKLSDVKELLGKEIIPLQLSWNKAMISVVSSSTWLLENMSAMHKVLFTSYTLDDERVKRVIEISKETKTIVLLEETRIRLLDRQKEIQDKLKELHEKEAKGKGYLDWKNLKGYGAELAKVTQQIVDLGLAQKELTAPPIEPKKPTSLGETEEEREERLKRIKEDLDEKQKIMQSWDDEQLKLKKEAGDKQYQDYIKKQEQLIDAEKLLHDTKLESIRKYGLKGIEELNNITEYENAVLKSKYDNLQLQYIDNEQAITMIKRASEIERTELVREQTIRRTQMEIESHRAVVMAYTRAGYAVSALVKQGIEESRTAAKKKQNILMSIAIAEGAASAVTAAKAGWDSGITYWDKAALAVAGALEAGAIAAGEIITIKSQKFAHGGIVGGNSFSGDRVPILANSGEMMINKQQQAQLFNLANGGSTTNNSSALALTINLSGNQTLDKNATQSIVDKMEELNQTLMMANRSGYLEPFKQQLGIYAGH